MEQAGKADEPGTARRGFLQTTATAAMTGGLAAGYGALAAVAGRFLYGSVAHGNAWQFVATLEQLPVGASLHYTAPDGARIVVARQSEGDAAEHFIALSSVCPHLGCQVHWEPQHDRFFCPCHNGTFDRQGHATAGPPAKSGQFLNRYSLEVRGNMLFILVPVSSVTQA